MFTFVLFALSGLAIATLLLGKRFEEKRKTSFFLFRWISLGDEWFRDLNHKILHAYSHGKEKLYFFLRKQVPMRAKNLFNKLQAQVKEWSERYMGDMRNTRLLKKSEGISEFFKTMGELEKGAGEINEVILTAEEAVESVFTPEPPAPKKKRAPKKKKVQVVEVE